MIRQEYKVFTIAGVAANEVLKTAEEGSAMHEVYYSQMDGNSDAFVKDDEEGLEKLLKEEKSLFYTSLLTPLGMKVHAWCGQLIIRQGL